MDTHASPDNPNLGPLINQVSIAHYVVAVLVVALRFYTRGFVVKKFGLDDYLIAAAVLLGAAQTATIWIEVMHGRGQHALNVELRHFNHMLMYDWINVMIYFLANWAVKMSILALYHRIGSAQKGLPWVLRSKVIWSMAVAITAFTTAVFLVELFGCTPISKAWDVLQMQAHCLRKSRFSIVQASINVFIDMILLVYPLPLLRIMKINIKQRTALVVIFSVGIVPLIASIMRLCEIVMAATPRGATWWAGDISWNWAWVPAWSQIEVDVGIVAASLPSLSPLLKQVWSGFATDRPMTPSQLPTLLGADMKSSIPDLSPWIVEIKDTKDEECGTWYNDARDSEELDCEAFLRLASEMGVAAAVDTKSSIERQGFRRADSGG